MELAPVAQEPLQRPRQSSVLIGEVSAQHLVQLTGGSFVGRRVALNERIELAAHHVDVDRRAGILQGVQADAQRTLDQLSPIVRRALLDEGSERTIRQAQTLDDDDVVLNADGQPLRRRRRDPECDYLGGFHVAQHPTVE